METKEITVFSENAKEEFQKVINRLQNMIKHVEYMMEKVDFTSISSCERTEYNNVDHVVYDEVSTSIVKYDEKHNDDTSEALSVSHRIYRLINGKYCLNYEK